MWRDRSLVLLAAATALAHETRTVGEGAQAHDVIVGYETEPAYTEERNGLTGAARAGQLPST